MLRALEGVTSGERASCQPARQLHAKTALLSFHPAVRWEAEIKGQAPSVAAAGTPGATGLDSLGRASLVLSHGIGDAEEAGAELEQGEILVVLLGRVQCLTPIRRANAGPGAVPTDTTERTAPVNPHFPARVQPGVGMEVKIHNRENQTLLQERS